MKNLLFLALALSGLTACSTSPDGTELNASFEHATPQGYPLGWYIEANQDTADVTLDEQSAHNGKRSLHMTTRDGSPIVAYTPLFNHECVTSLQASAMTRTTGEAKTALFFLESGKAPMMGDASGGDWQQVNATVSGDGCLPGDLMIGIFVQGEGEAWIDALQVNDPAGKYSAPMMATATHDAADIDAIDRRALSLDDDAIIDHFANTRVVGLGENSHGAANLFAMKTELVQRLVTELDFTIFALEMPAGNAATVNDYIHGRHDDDRAALLALSYPAWQTREMWNVIEWLREFNEANGNTIRFIGLDGNRSPDDTRSDDEIMFAEAMMMTSEKMIIWADNTHVTKQSSAMGGLLARELGDGYLAVGLTFNEGSYSAYGPEKHYVAQTGYPGTHEAVLSAARANRFLLDHDALPDGHALLDIRGFRYLGSRPQPFNQFYPHRLEEHFDLIGFIERTDHTEYLVDHEF